jgi:hypothetical protein
MALNPGGKTAVDKKDLKIAFTFGGCCCHDYQNYEEHIKNHLGTRFCQENTYCY